MAREFKLPDLGEGIHEGEVISVLVSVGDKVEEGDPILEVETDKASVEIPSPFTATVEAIQVEAGDTVSVGDVLMTFSDVESEADVEQLAGEESAREKGTEEKEEKQPQKEKTTEKKSQEAAEAKKEKEKAEPERETAARREAVPASPSTRRLARELDVDLRQVEPSGPGGRVTADDVRSAAEGKQKKKPAREAERPEREAAEAAAPAPELPDFSRWGSVERQPLRSIRKATARQMALAWSQIPHVTTQDEVDLTRLERLRQRHKQTVEAEGGKLTVTVFAVKAVAAALKKFPQFNTALDMENREIIQKKYCHVGVATDTGEGLVVPVLRDVDRKSIFEIAVEFNDLVQRTRARQIDLEEMKGGCMTVTNIGAAGGRGHFAPIINYPETAILGLSAARMQPVVRTTENGDHRMEPRLIMPVVITIDHRVLDGVDSTRFLEFFRTAMEDPEAMLLHI
jgi:pyruvate dehydrogenase E2 component (dihydrolipoamide acetyltransferase)